jgi:cell division septal protein FtsQ
MYGLTASSAFALRQVEISEMRYTDVAAIRSNLPVTEGANLFALATQPLVDRLLALPAVAGVQVDVGLPDRLVVRVEERSPVMVWQVGNRGYLVDRRGVLFAEVGPAGAGAGGSPAVADLPTVIDSRLSSEAALTETDLLDPVVVDAATRLASITPADIGSIASQLTVELGDESGFVMHAAPTGWVAIFGFYTPTLRTTDLIPGQVRLLRSLLADREATVAQVVLADENNGTYLPRPTPKSGPSGKP